VPLIVHDPFVSVWSASDNLTDAFPSFWAGQVLGMVGMLRVDGVAYRWMGQDTFNPTPNVPPAQQTSVTVSATTTTYAFAAGGVALGVSFSTPVLGDDLATWIANPVTFLTLTAASADGAPHDVGLYFEHTAELAVNDVSANISWARDTPAPIPGAAVMRVGSASQDVLGASGDGMRISWGYQYLVVPTASVPGVAVQTTMAAWTNASFAFVRGQDLPSDDGRQPRACSDDWLVLAAAWDLGTVTPARGPVAVTAMVAYDEIASISYFGSPLAPGWTMGNGSGNGNDTVTVHAMLSAALANASALVAAASRFDAEVDAQASAAAGSAYAQLAALTYRQTLGSIVYVVPPPPSATCGPRATGTGPLAGLWALLEEQSSDGDVDTVDVIYPAFPALAYVCPELVWALLLPVLDYAANCTNTAYNLTWAPHHLGTWPIANLPPAHQEQMPIE
jgi:hypothetical protein